MDTTEHAYNVKIPRKRVVLLQTLIVFAGFCALSYLSRFVPVVFLLVMGFGLFFPLAWGRITGDWQGMGFTRKHLGRALGWGMTGGGAWMVYTYLVFGPGQEVPYLVYNWRLGFPSGF